MIMSLSVDTATGPDRTGEERGTGRASIAAAAPVAPSLIFYAILAAGS